MGKMDYLTFSGTSLAISDISLVFACGLALVLLVIYFWPYKSAGKAVPGALGSKTAGKSIAVEQTAEQASEQASVVINAIDDGVIAVDSKGTIHLINPAAQKMIGWTGGDALNLIYKSVLKLVDSKDQPVSDAIDPVLLTLNTNTTSESDSLSLLTGSGKRRMISIVVSPVGDLGSGAIIVFRDITKSKAEEREQAEFISTASHEMRTPVASIEGYLGLALNPNTAQIDQKAREFIEKAHASAQHLGRLFQDLLDVSKADDGRLSNYPEVVDVVEFVGSVVEDFKLKAEEKGLVLKYIPDPSGASMGQKTVAPMYFANVDNDHLREIVSNLIENAIKYTHEGEVTVDVVGDGEHVSVSVKDSGIGIPAEDISHLFQKFYRIDNTDTREIGGTGLGLYLCRRLAEVMGGRIDVTSEFKKGSVFTLTIDKIERGEAAKLKEQQAQAKAASATPQPTATLVASATTAPAPQPAADPAPVAPQPAATPTPQPAAPATSVSPQTAPAPQQPQPVVTVPRAAPPVSPNIRPASVFQPAPPAPTPSTSQPVAPNSQETTQNPPSV